MTSPNCIRTSRLSLESLEAREVPAAVGALDPSFGTGGVTAVVPVREFVGVAIQNDGKIVAISDFTADFFITRYNPNGTVDTSFGTSGTGVVTVDIAGAGQSDQARGVAIDANDKIVVVGNGGAAVTDFAIVRLSADGKAVELNAHFHIGVATDGAVARAVAFQSDGTIVMAGDAKIGTDSDFAIARVDPSTGVPFGGPVTVDFGGGFDDVARAVSVDSFIGKIVVVGTASIGSGNSNIGIVQRNADLTVDTFFNGGTGQKTIDGSGNDEGRAVATDREGNIVVAGDNGAVDKDIIVARLFHDGTLSGFFGSGGIKTIVKAGTDRAAAVAIQRDDKIVVGGDSSNLLDVGVLRLNSNGALDSSFSGDGDATFDVSGDDDGNAVAIDPDGRILIAGDNGSSAGFLARLIGTVEKGQNLLVGGNPDGTVSEYSADPSTGNYGSTPFFTYSPFFGFSGVVRTAFADVDGDGVADNIAITGPGTPIKLTVLGKGSILVPPTSPFAGSEGFTGGGFVAAADLDGDGRAEIIVTPDRGGGPRVTIFSVNPDGAFVVRANFFGIDDPSFRGGCRAAAGDVNGDGVADLAVAAGFLGGPRVAIFNGKTVFSSPTRLVGDFFAFSGSDAVTLRNGSFVSIGDVNGDGFDDLIFGGGPGGAPRVFILSGQQVSSGDVAGAQASPIANFFVAGNSTDRGGVRITARDSDRDNKAEVAAGSGEGSPSNVRVYLGKNFTGSGEPGTFQDISVFGGLALTDGVFVG